MRDESMLMKIERFSYSSLIPYPSSLFLGCDV
ncbi:MAG: hypothetical protein QOJ02_2790, partial [Acidobacteriota bacterium]|nr:hypothetical protein [Acidobacteriota bacterium]